DAPGFIKKLNNPSQPFYIGRREDMAIPVETKIQTSFLVNKIFPQTLKYGYWASRPSVQQYGIHGAVYLLGTYYKIEEKIRNFERRRFYYIEPQPLNPIKNGNKYQAPQGWVDTCVIDGNTDGNTVDIPVFFLGIHEPESDK
ncbi:MAG TPA: hypothetical protein VK186_01135, partial [Candidatus Deferrimicrobium sp.]|nr:hypothetical protein [Candidatus Deferrimicrobium sp.]